MFIISIKASKRKLVALCAVVALVIVVGVGILLGQGAVSAGAKTNSTSGANNEERLAFLTDFGWKVDNEPIEIVEVAIPTEFNDVYEVYNGIQKKQGFDLTEYRGKKCKRWTYAVINYPENQMGVRANILTYNDKIIGGDICSAELDGFMHGFSKD